MLELLVVKCYDNRNIINIYNRIDRDSKKKWENIEVDVAGIIKCKNNKINAEVSKEVEEYWKREKNIYERRKTKKKTRKTGEIYYNKETSKEEDKGKA